MRDVAMVMKKITYPLLLPLFYCNRSSLNLDKTQEIEPIGLDHSHSG